MSTHDLFWGYTVALGNIYSTYLERFYTDALSEPLELTCIQVWDQLSRSF